MSKLQYNEKKLNWYFANEVILIAKYSIEFSISSSFSHYLLIDKILTLEMCL